MTNSFIEGLLKLPEHISDFRLANRSSARPYHFFFFAFFLASSSSRRRRHLHQRGSFSLDGTKRQGLDSFDIIVNRDGSSVASSSSLLPFFHPCSGTCSSRIVWLSKDVTALVGSVFTAIPTVVRSRSALHEEHSGLPDSRCCFEKYH